jgi:hypothetical protein
LDARAFLSHQFPCVAALWTALLSNADPGRCRDHPTNLTENVNLTHGFPFACLREKRWERKEARMYVGLGTILLIVLIVLLLVWVF